MEREDVLNPTRLQAESDSLREPPRVTRSSPERVRVRATQQQQRGGRGVEDERKLTYQRECISQLWILLAKQYHITLYTTKKRHMICCLSKVEGM